MWKKIVLVGLLTFGFSANAFAIQCVDYITKNYSNYAAFNGSGNAKNWANLNREIPSEADAYAKDKNKPKKAPKPRKFSDLYKISSTPTTGSVIVFDSFSGNSAGHVGYVSSVSGDKITIDHANWSLSGVADGNIVKNFKAKKGSSWSKVQMWWEGTVNKKPFKDYGSTQYTILGYITKK